MNIFPKNARVCFLGDSITHNNEYVSRICQHYLENHKDLNVKFFNGGTSGGSVNTLLVNFDTDVIAHSPTHAVIMIGINDSARWLLEEERSVRRYELLKERYELYKNNITTLYEKLKQQNIEVIFCTPTPYDEYQQSESPAFKGAFALVAEYAWFIRSFAEKVGAPVCDFHAYISHVAQLEQIINPDRIHPNSLGQYHMAKCFLEFQGETIGEYAPIAEYLGEWRSVVAKLRSIRATEHMVICDYSLTIEDRIQKAKDYIASGGSGEHREYFLLLSNQYLEYKPVQDELEEQANRLMDSLYL